MWEDDNLTVESKEEKRNFHFWVKHYETGSEFGIDGGRISKLMVKDMDTQRIVINYDRGWDVKPVTECEKAALDVLKARYN